MRLASITLDGNEVAAIVTDGGCVPVPALAGRLGEDWPHDLLGILVEQRLDAIREWYDIEGKQKLPELSELTISNDTVRYAPLYRRPRKIWGIGLNYTAHAADLSEKTPESEPASFMKPDTTIIGHGDDIRLPKLSRRTTGEAELGLVFSRTCRNVDRADWLSVLAGFTTIIDMTAEDILRRNPRNLTQSKSFDTFFSFGPILYTVDEIGDIPGLEVRTILNDEVRAKNTVANMTFPPDVLVSYHSQIMTMLPGDIISTGTPGAVPLKQGDTIACSMGDFRPLVNRVIDDTMTGPEGA